MRREAIRAAAFAAIAVQPLFIAAWIVAGALQPGYSHARSGVSALGANGAAHPWIVNAALVLLGLSLVALGFCLYNVLPRRRARTVALLLFAGAGLSLALTGPANMDCDFAYQHCRRLFDHGGLTWRTDAHLWLGLAAEVFLLLTPFAVARAIAPSPAAGALIAAALAGGAIGIATWFLEAGSGGSGGLWQRVGLLVLHEWALIVAGAVLYATRRAPALGALIPLRPRDFMAGEWRGDGELIMRPFFLGRLFAQHFEARRRTTSISDTLWRIDDEAEFGGGRTQRRQTFAEWVSEDRLRLTANDLPDGAEMWLEDGGYRTAPVRMAFPIGPLPVLVRVHDSSYMADDGTFVNQFDAHDVVFGIPLARTVFRVRPVRAEYSRASASGARPASSEASPAPG